MYEVEEARGLNEESDDTDYKTNIYNISVLESRDMISTDVEELATIGAELTYGDFLVYERSVEEDPDLPENAKCYSYIGARGIIYQIIITWEEGIAPGFDTPLVSAVLSLESDPSICADMMKENVAKVLNYKLTPGGK